MLKQLEGLALVAAAGAAIVGGLTAWPLGLLGVGLAGQGFRLVHQGESSELPEEHARRELQKSLRKALQTLVSQTVGESLSNSQVVGRGLGIWGNVDPTR